MAALAALLPEELERHYQLQRSRLDTYQKLREEVVLDAEARGYVAPNLGRTGTRGQRRSYGCWRIRTMERTTHFQGKAEQPHWQRERERDRKRWCKNHQDKQTRRRFKVSVGIAGKQVINRRTAGQDHRSRVKDNQILLERETMSNASQARVEERKANPKMLEHLCGISKLEVQLRDRWRRFTTDGNKHNSWYD